MKTREITEIAAANISLAHSFSEEDLNRLYAPAFHPVTDLSADEQFATLYKAVIVKEEEVEEGLPPALKRKSTSTDRRRASTTNGKGARSSTGTTQKSASISNNRGGSSRASTKKRASGVKKEENNYPRSPSRDTSEIGKGAKNVTQLPTRNQDHKNFNEESTDDNDDNNGKNEDIGSTGLYVEIAGVRSPVKNFFAPTDMLMKKQQETLSRVEKAFEELKQNFVKTDEESGRLISQYDADEEILLFPPSRQEERLSRIISELELAHASAIDKEKEEERWKQEMENNTSKRFFERNNSYREDMEQKNHIIQAQAQRSSLVRDMNEQKTRRISREETFSEWMDKKWAATQTLSERFGHLEDTVNKVFRDTETHMLHGADRARGLSCISTYGERVPIINGDDGAYGEPTSTYGEPTTQPDHDDDHVAGTELSPTDNKNQEDATATKSFRATLVSNPFRRSTTTMYMEDALQQGDGPTSHHPTSGDNTTPGEMRSHEEKGKEIIPFKDEAMSVGRTTDENQDGTEETQRIQSKDSNLRSRITEVRNPFRASISAASQIDPPPPSFDGTETNASRALKRARDKPNDDEEDVPTAGLLSAQEEMMSRTPCAVGQHTHVHDFSSSISYGPTGVSISAKDPHNITSDENVREPPVDDFRSGPLQEESAGLARSDSKVPFPPSEHARPILEDPIEGAKGESAFTTMSQKSACALPSSSSSSSMPFFKSTLDHADMNIENGDDETSNRRPVIKADIDGMVDPFQRDIWVDPKMGVVKQESYDNMERVTGLSVHLPNLASPDPMKIKDPNIQARVTHANNPGFVLKNVRAVSSTNLVVSSPPIPTTFQPNLHMRREDQGCPPKETEVDEKNPSYQSMERSGSDVRTCQDPEGKDACADEKKQGPLEDRSTSSEPRFRELKPHNGKQGESVADVGSTKENNNNDNNNPFLADIWTDPKASTSPDQGSGFEKRALKTSFGAQLRSSVSLDSPQLRSSVSLDSAQLRSSVHDLGSRSSVSLGLNRLGPDLVQLNPGTAKEIAELRNPFLEELGDIWEGVNGKQLRASVRGEGTTILPEFNKLSAIPPQEEKVSEEDVVVCEISNPFMVDYDIWLDTNEKIVDRGSRYQRKDMDMEKLILPKNNNAAEGSPQQTNPTTTCPEQHTPAPRLPPPAPRLPIDASDRAPNHTDAARMCGPDPTMMGDITAVSTPTLDVTALRHDLYAERGADINAEEEAYQPPQCVGGEGSKHINLERSWEYPHQAENILLMRSAEDNILKRSTIPRCFSGSTIHLQPFDPDPHLSRAASSSTSRMVEKNDTSSPFRMLGQEDSPPILRRSLWPGPYIRQKNGSTTAPGAAPSASGGNNPLPGAQVRLEPYDIEDRRSDKYRGNNKLHHSQSYPDLTSLGRPNIKELTGVASPFPPQVSGYNHNNHNNTLEARMQEKRSLREHKKEAYSRRFLNPRFQRNTSHISPFNNVQQRTSHLSPYGNVQRRTVSPYSNVQQRTVSPYNNVQRRTVSPNNAQQHKMMNNGGGTNQRQSPMMMHKEDARRHEYLSALQPKHRTSAPPNAADYDEQNRASNRISFIGQALFSRPSVWGFLLYNVHLRAKGFF